MEESSSFDRRKSQTENTRDIHMEEFLTEEVHGGPDIAQHEVPRASVMC